MQQTTVPATDLKVGDTVNWSGRRPTITSVERNSNSIEFTDTEGRSYLVAADSNLLRITD